MELTSLLNILSRASTALILATALYFLINYVVNALMGVFGLKEGITSNMLSLGASLLIVLTAFEFHDVY